MSVKSGNEDLQLVIDSEKCVTQRLDTVSRLSVINQYGKSESQKMALLLEAVLCKIEIEAIE
jgi:hypothetical protein